VLKYLDGKGKHKGKVGALWCDMGNGLNFSVGSGQVFLFVDCNKDDAILP
jgi:hypothetical protein